MKIGGLEHLVVRVDLMNDAGERQSVTAAGLTVDGAVWEAETGVQLDTGDLSWTMTDWRAA